MRRIDWPRLIRLGLVDLRLRPGDFWELTPAELLLLAGHGAGPEALTRRGLAELLARFPDARDAPIQEGQESGI
ncbi:rcc01693 family protein [Amaricoccus solimangrovi]|uniref:Phage tail assembly chaperone n=1 Tax=Amaricoccus solimangrovi TaxID=2589815 RepID=A0A501WUU4_9RHOB|nr:rcc01693 family protein [Amaricoccus solimangrovi]TPE50721.1 phage tail assembly chaperone [Amaricoccus solimangrovi]